MRTGSTRREALKAMGVGCLGLLAGCRSGAQAAAAGNSRARWYRGNLHMHTYWSDGRIFPEQAIDIYKRLGYDFIGLSDHNVFASDAAQWRTVEDKEGKWPPAVTRPVYESRSATAARRSPPIQAPRA